MSDLFDMVETEQTDKREMGAGAVLLPGRALPFETDILTALEAVVDAAPFRHMMTPGGHTMSVAVTNCGIAGWTSDRKGYRYDRNDPSTGKPWPAMPLSFQELASAAASEGGYPGFDPDACLINRYEPGARLTLHQDKNERDFDRPIVTVSLGLPATFQFGGLKRSDPVTRHSVRHGDVAVWGGPSRLFFHGVLALKDGRHPKTGGTRISLTFREAL